MARKKPSWVFEAWDDLVLANAEKHTPEELRQKWHELFLATTDGDGWTVSLSDASLVASLGWRLAMEDRDFPKARHLARMQLAHPEVTDRYLLRDGDVVVDEAVADALCGNLEDGVSKLSAYLSRVKESSIIRHLVRNHTAGLIAELGIDEACHPGVRSLVVEILLSYKGNKRAAKAAGVATSNRELAEILSAAFGWEPPEWAGTFLKNALSVTFLAFRSSRSNSEKTAFSRFKALSHFCFFRRSRRDRFGLALVRAQRVLVESPMFMGIYRYLM